MSSTIMQRLPFITFIVSEYPMLKFSTSTDTCPMKNMLVFSSGYTPVTQIILCIIFLMYVAIIQCLHCRRQEWNLQFIFLTCLWPWNKVKVINLQWQCRPPSKVIITKSLKDLALMVSEKKPTCSALIVSTLKRQY